MVAGKSPDGSEISKDVDGHILGWHKHFTKSEVAEARAVANAKVIEREREAREKQEKRDGMAKKDDKREESAGMVLVVVRNLTPDVATTRGARQQSSVFHLTPESFALGEFKYDIVLDGLKSATFALKETAVPFLAPVKAQEFENASSVSSK
jgi:hypothetical protein